MNYLKTISLFLTITPTLALAQGGGVTGGGDPCKNLIDQQREAIRGWILRDEASTIDFSKAKIKGLGYFEEENKTSYKTKMLEVLEPGRVIVTCYLDPARQGNSQAESVVSKTGVAYRAITIGSPATNTACINYEDESGHSHIDCNYDSILNEDARGALDFKLTHHEFASIAGIEERTGTSISDFSISNQLSNYEHWVKIKVLGPIANLSNECNLPRNHVTPCKLLISKDLREPLKCYYPEMKAEGISCALFQDEIELTTKNITFNDSSKTKRIRRIEFDQEFQITGMTFNLFETLKLNDHIRSTRTVMGNRNHEYHADFGRYHGELALLKVKHSKIGKQKQEKPPVRFVPLGASPWFPTRGNFR